MKNAPSGAFVVVAPKKNFGYNEDMSMKRLFLVAAYDPTGQGVVDASLVMYVRALAAHGDVVVVMDNDAPDQELKKLAPFTVYAAGTRHGEYDFGSYKRAYIYARDTLGLGNYDVMYMVNDSVYGPLHDIGPVLDRMEGLNTDAFGMVYKMHRTRPHIESWFLGFRPSVFGAQWFDDFMRTITKLQSKGDVIALYENGLANQIRDRGYTTDGVWHVRGRGTYNRVAGLYRAGMPFIKKMSWRRKCGALGGQISYVLRHCDGAARDAIMENALRVYGARHNQWLITRNPLKIMYRNIKHFFRKIFIEGF